MSGKQKPKAKGSLRGVSVYVAPCIWPCSYACSIICAVVSALPTHALSISIYHYQSINLAIASLGAVAPTLVGHPESSNLLPMLITLPADSDRIWSAWTRLHKGCDKRALLFH